MNSEITNVSKLVPAAVVKSNQQNGDSASLKSDAVNEQKVDEASVGANLFTVGQISSPLKNVTNVETLKSAAVAGNSILQSVNRNLEFKVDDSTKKVVVKIVDNQSGETVRQIPSEDMMTFIKKMQELDGKTGSVIQDRA